MTEPFRTAICCLWQGTDLPEWSASQYDWKYVDALAWGLHRHVENPRLVVLVDKYHRPMLEEIKAPIRIEVYDLVSDSVGGWARRMQAFSPMLWPSGEERFVTMDLDMILVGDCTWLWEWNEAPVGLPADPFFPTKPCSTIVSYSREGAHQIWSYWKEGAESAKLFGLFSEMQLLRQMRKIYHWPFLENGVTKLLSYKQHIGKERRPWGDASIVYFHGKPKPHTMLECSLKDRWTSTS